ncbi:MAG: class I SAM-dependent methyltransferase [Oscillospiraceae bacterium]|nr:class I SAM-dependent methyltransferase [Oscillospiraceae bacterium]
MRILLDDRLTAAAQFVRKDKVCADVGCDHGKLTAYLAQNNLCTKVIAIDVNQDPLQKAQQLVEKCGCGHKVECRLADGLKGLAPKEAQDIVIAGLSGVTIAALIEAEKWVRQEDIRLILVPASKPDTLRTRLLCQGFVIQQEKAVLAADRPYTVMCAAYCGTPAVADRKYSLLGELANQKGEAAQRYRKKIVKQLKKEYQGMEQGARYSAQQKQQLCALIQEVETLCQE